MKIRCSPYNPLLCFVFLGMSVFFSQHAALAQCSGDFSFHSVSAEKNSNSGQIEVSLKSPANGAYTFKVFEMAGTLTLVQTRKATAPGKVIFENLKPATYFIKIEWGESCSKTIGGFDGIVITEKDQGR
ncbi:MAG: T9SS type A sorting domain-containing protein [Chryseosolibacter sp.]